MPVVLHRWQPLLTVYNLSGLHVHVLGGRRALLKLCFQVFIVLSSADEAGTCRVYEGMWGVAALGG